MGQPDESANQDIHDYRLSELWFLGFKIKVSCSPSGALHRSDPKSPYLSGILFFLTIKNWLFRTFKYGDALIIFRAHSEPVNHVGIFT